MKPRIADRSRQRGSALMIVLVILVILLMYIVGNSVMLHQLNRDLSRIDRQQQAKLRPGPPSATGGSAR